ncbi:XRE family transcriptional regulator [Peribacillus frigoritolerans]|uniref:XRE family transcriptional regulator n=1 Tax=Peribacillus castrilensis TaxID=2897690 RepID=A0AAW9N8W2_9BACI|nr:XRE family transcriptional regulator [Peribacillus castrilensis]
MLKNLKIEMLRSDVKPAQIAEFLNRRYATIIDKLNGHYDFTFKEALKIKNEFFPEHSLEYLFVGDDEDDSKKKRCKIS